MRERECVPRFSQPPSIVHHLIQTIAWLPVVGRAFQPVRDRASSYEESDRDPCSGRAGWLPARVDGLESLAILALAVGLLVAPAAAQDKGELFPARLALGEKFTAEMTALVDVCRQQQLAEQEQQTRAWIAPRNPRLLYSPRLPAELRTPLPDDAPAAVRDWHAQFWKLREAYADGLIDLSRRAVNERRPALAYEWVLEAAHQNPDHADARRLLGYRQYKGFWRTDFEIRQLQSNKVWHDQFGWLRKDFVERYEQGDRFVANKWVGKAEEAQLRGDIGMGWEIETDHYEITTNTSLEDGVALGRKLEDLYRVWQHTFVRFYVTPGDLQKLFAGRAGSRRVTVRHKVFYFRSKAEYVRHLQHSVPQDLGITSGFYYGDNETAYFFAGPGSDESTLVHEATHQLFSEVNRQVHAASSRNQFWLRKPHNFWLVEGVACYMETLSEREHQFTLGGGSDARMRGALVRRFRDDYFVPFREMVALGMTDLQKRSDIGALYGQSAAVVSFLMHYENGRYRDALIDYLYALYMGRDKLESLTTLTGQPLDKLEQEFHSYMQTTARQVVADAEK